jgi:hypothetical protein
MRRIVGRGDMLLGGVYGCVCAALSLLEVSEGCWVGGGDGG